MTIKNSDFNRVALCFVIPELNMPENSASNTTYCIFNESIKNFKQENNIVASYFPQHNARIEYDGCYYPGVAIVAELLI